MIEVGSFDLDTVLHLSCKEFGTDFFSFNQRPTHFRLREFQSKDGADEVLLSVRLLYLLEEIRRITDQPVSINSGYRTPAHNRKVGGSKNSQHVLGKAADIVVGRMHGNVGNALKIAILASQLGFKGIGVYPTFTHVDVRDEVSHWDNTNQNLLAFNEFYYKV